MGEILHFKVSSGLKNILGKELITNEIVAIFELVKNSYDANARKIEILFDMQKGCIEIMDDGHGMSYKDINEKWLFVAYSEKKDNINQAFAGSKGIGRLSCDRLGKNLTLISKKNNITSKLDIDWGEFEGDDKRRFEDLDVLYQIIDQNVIKNNSGTKLIISNLRDEWKKSDIEKVTKSLEKLINPFKEDNSFEILVKYIENTGVEEPYTRVQNTILNLLDDKTTFLHCTIKNNLINVKLVDRRTAIYNIIMKNDTLLKDVEIKIYFLNQVAKNNFTRRMGIESKNYGSIFLYKNGFRVYPFGEVDFDAFGLNLRKTQGYNRNLGHRELLGWIEIQDHFNNFQEVSSRDAGFITNAYTVELERIYFNLVQKPLEAYMQLIKFGGIVIENQDEDVFQDQFDKLLNRYKKYNIIKIEKYELPKLLQPIETKISILENEKLSEKDKQNFLDSIKENAINLQIEANQVKKELEQTKKEKNKLIQEIDLKNKVISKQKPGREEYLEHELSKVSDGILLSLYSLVDELSEHEKEKTQEYVLDVIKICKKLKEIQKVILRVDFDTKVNKNKVNLIYYIQSYINSLVTSKNVDIRIQYDDNVINSYVKAVNIFDVGLILDNLISNAIDLSATQINIIFDKNGVFSVISDTTAISVLPIDRIFDYGFTTKKDGYGIGLYIVKDSIEQLGWKIGVNNLSNQSVEFRIDTNTVGDMENEKRD